MAEVYQVNINAAGIGGMPSGGASMPGMGGGSVEERENATMRNYGKLLKDNTSGFWKKIGVDFTLRSLLKQSQLFTGTFGAFFQIVGAFIDVILTPFMPLIIPVIKKLASWIPTIKDDAQKLFNWIKGIFKIVWTPIDNFIKGIKALLPDSVEQWLGKFFTHKSWLYLMGTLGALVATSAGRGLIARGGRGLGSEIGMTRAFGMDHVAMRGRGAGGFLARNARPRSWSSMGRGMKFGGGAMGAAGGIAALGGMMQDGSTAGSRALNALGAGAQIGGMFFGPIGMAVGTAMNVGLQAYAAKMANDNRKRQSEQTMGGQHGVYAGSDNITFIMQTQDGTQISDQRLVGNAIERGGLYPSVQIQREFSNS